MPKKTVPPTEHKSHPLRTPGILLILYAVAGFAVNFHIIEQFVTLPFTGALANAWAIFWNPLSLFAAQITGGVWLLGGALSTLLSYVFALFWAFGLGILGVVLAK